MKSKLILTALAQTLFVARAVAQPTLPAPAPATASRTPSPGQPQRFNRILGTPQP